jgi:hypothetical protein
MQKTNIFAAKSASLVVRIDTTIGNLKITTINRRCPKSQQVQSGECSNVVKGQLRLTITLAPSIAILLQRPVYCFWRADFHGQGATRVTPDNFMYSLPTILPCCSGRSGARYFK